MKYAGYLVNRHVYNPLWYLWTPFEKLMLQNIKQRFDVIAKISAVGLFLCFPFSLALGNVFMVLLVLFWLLSGDYEKRWKIVRHKSVVWLALGLYFLLLLGVTYTVASFNDIQLSLVKYSKLLIMVLLISLLDDAAWRERCMNAFLVGMLFVLGTIYATIWFDVPWAVTHAKGWGGEHVAFGDRITQSIMVTFLVLLALVKSNNVSCIGLKVFWWTVALLSMVSITHLSGGRTGYLLLITVLIIFSIFSGSGLKRVSILSLLVAAVVVLAFSSKMLQQRVQLAASEAKSYETMEITSIGGRINFWKKSLQLIEERPWVGWGTGSYHDQWCRITSDRVEWCSFGRWHPHNQFLLFWLENGVLGLVIFAAFVFSPILSRENVPSARSIMIGFSIMFFINSMVNSSLWSSRENHFFIFMMALFMSGSNFFSSQESDINAHKSVRN